MSGGGTAAIILAAGRGTRFGGAKSLAKLDGRPILQHVLDLAAEAELAPVLVVLGADADEQERACTWRSETRLRNPDPDAGLSSSVRIGLDELELTDAERVLMLLADQPLLTLERLAVILAADASGRPIVAPVYDDGLPGNPVRIDRSAWALARRLTGDRGMAQLFASHPGLVAYCRVGGTNPDVDTRADLAALSRD